MPEPYGAPLAARLAALATAAEPPPEVLADAADRVLDTLGCALAAHGLGAGAAARDVAAAAGGAAEASLIGSRERVPVAAAALGNAGLAHALDFDDTHERSVCHVSAVVVPAALACAEARGAAGAELLAAVAAGSEVTARVGLAAPGAFHRRGFHPTGVCGAIGAAAAAARLAGLDAAQATAALAIASSFGSGHFAYLEDGSQTKPLHAAWAAHGGVLAAQLAAAGAEGAARALEGRFGLYETHVDEEPDLGAAIDGLGERWECVRSVVKPYPACHFSHAALDAAARAAGALPLDAAAVEEVTVRTSAEGAALVLEPREAKLRPRTPYEAKFSLPYCVAALLLRGSLGLGDFTPEAIADERVLALAARVRGEAWPPGREPAPFAGAAELRLAGESGPRAATIAVARGGPGDPLGEAALLQKFRGNANLALAERAAESLAAAIRGLPSGAAPAAVGDALRAPVRA